MKKRPVLNIFYSTCSPPRKDTEYSKPAFGAAAAPMKTQPALGQHVPMGTLLASGVLGRGRGRKTSRDTPDMAPSISTQKRQETIWGLQTMSRRGKDKALGHASEFKTFIECSYFKMS